MSTAPLIRGLDLLERLIDVEDPRLLREHAADLGIPVSSAHRLFNSLLKGGLLRRAQRGSYLPGPRLIALIQLLDMHQVMGQLARPLLRKLSRSLDCTAHLGILESQMVTYLVKEKTDSEVFSREGAQLEAYCSAIGKVLLASLPSEALDAYLMEGRFVALTPHTKVDPKAIGSEVEVVQSQGYALDIEEICEGLRCLAVPVRGVRGRVCAAISVSRYGWDLGDKEIERTLGELHACAAELGALLGAESSPT
jgi:DNA-binding IclR family transcriptional regulator